jgi:hypothetical protein
MAWLRRTNENNVDLNRNFIADGNYSGAPDHYRDIDAFLNPESSPSGDFFLMKAAAMILRFGLTTLVQSIGGGQYEYPRGLFFGGKRLEEGLEKYYSFLREHLNSARTILGIDVHTGLGLFGRDLLLVEKQDYSAFRERLGRRVTLLEPERGPAYRIRGGLQRLLSSSAPNGAVQFMIQEFGTYNPIRVLQVLREENRWHHFGDGSLSHSSKTRLKDVFDPRSPRWRRRVLTRGQDLIEKAVGTLLRAAYS